MLLLAVLGDIASALDGDFLPYLDHSMKLTTELWAQVTEKSVSQPARVYIHMGAYSE